MATKKKPAAKKAPATKKAPAGPAPAATTPPPKKSSASKRPDPQRTSVAPAPTAQVQPTRQTPATGEPKVEGAPPMEVGSSLVPEVGSEDEENGEGETPFAGGVEVGNHRRITFNPELKGARRGREENEGIRMCDLDDLRSVLLEAVLMVKHTGLWSKDEVFEAVEEMCDFTKSASQLLRAGYDVPFTQGLRSMIPLLHNTNAAAPNPQPQIKASQAPFAPFPKLAEIFKQKDVDNQLIIRAAAFDNAFPSNAKNMWSIQPSVLRRFAKATDQTLDRVKKISTIFGFGKQATVNNFLAEARKGIIPPPNTQAEEYEELRNTIAEYYIIFDFAEAPVYKEIALEEWRTLRNQLADCLDNLSPTADETAGMSGGIRNIDGEVVQKRSGAVIDATSMSMPRMSQRPFSPSAVRPEPNRSVSLSGQFRRPSVDPHSYPTRSDFEIRLLDSQNLCHRCANVHYHGTNECKHPMIRNVMQYLRVNEPLMRLKLNCPR